MKKIQDIIKKYRTESLIIMMSLAVFTIGTFIIDFWISLGIVVGLNIVCFWKPVKSSIARLIKNIQSKKKSSPKTNIKRHRTEKIDRLDKPIYEFKQDDDIVTIKDAKKDEDMKKKSKAKTQAGGKVKKWVVRFLQVCLIIGCFLFITAIGFGVWFAAYIMKNAPDFIPENLYSTEPSVVYYADGSIMATIGTENRVIVNYDDLPEVLINALIAVEDSKFFQHNGVDIQRFMVASAQQLIGRRGAGGASTLTMQLSKNYVQGDTTASGWEGIVRKFTDVYLSVFHIEPTYTKEEIIEFYVNSSQLGSAYGVEAAARTYFNKSVKDINVSEAALLAGMYQAPSSYNPFYHPQAAEGRRKTALGLMLRHGYINRQEYDIAMRMTVDKIVVDSDEESKHSSDEMDNRVRSAVDTIVREVRKKTGKDPRQVSMKIYTTIDKKLQLHVGDIFTGKSKKYKWENSKVTAGVAVVDIKTGALVAVGGNRENSKDNTFNHATMSNYQTGSAAKPLFDYGPAVEYLNWSTGTLLSDESMTYSNGTTISNWDNRYVGVATASRHMVLSRNIPALKAFQAAGKDRVQTFVKNLGLHPEPGMHEAHAIGGYNGDNPLTMAAAYAAFGNGGYYAEPYTVNKIVYSATGETYTNSSAPRQVMSSSTAYIVTKMLQDTAAYGQGMGSYRNVNGIKYATKSGTTNFDRETMKQHKLPSGAVRDLWTVSYNTEYAIGVWYGYASVKDGYNRLGSTQSARLFNAVAQTVFSNKSDFKMPNTVSRVEIETGCATLMRPSEFTPASFKKYEFFVKGTEPTDVSTRFTKLNNASNLVATSDYGTIQLSWAPVATPDAFNRELLKGLNRSAFIKDGALNTYVTSVINKNTSTLGNIGYEVYVETETGLTLLGWTANPNYTVTGYDGSYTFVVRTAYSKFKSNRSDGIRVTATGYQ